MVLPPGMLLLCCGTDIGSAATRRGVGVHLGGRRGTTTTCLGRRAWSVHFDLPVSSTNWALCA
eukprot:1970428-Rhodomonas_salina.1